MFGLNFNFASLVSQIALAAATGGASMAMQMAMKAIVSAVAQQVLQQLGQQLGLPQSIISGAQMALGAATGTQGSAGNLTDVIGQIAQQFGLSNTQQGELQRTADTAVDQLVNQALKENTGYDDEDGQKSKGKNSGKSDFFTMFAKIMGQKLDKAFKDMAAKADATNWKDSKAVTDFQADQQKFSFFMNSISTALKTVGEALTAMARKN